MLDIQHPPLQELPAVAHPGGSLLLFCVRRHLSRVGVRTLCIGERELELVVEAQELDARRVHGGELRAVLGGERLDDVGQRLLGPAIITGAVLVGLCRDADLPAIQRECHRLDH